MTPTTPEQSALAAARDAWLALYDRLDAEDEVRPWLTHLAQAPTLAIQTRRGEGWVANAGGFGPTQGDLLVDGHLGYYRAEEGSWSIRFAEAGQAGWRVAGDDAAEPGLARSSSPEGTWVRIERAIADFRAGRMHRLTHDELHDLDLELAFVRMAYRGRTAPVPVSEVSAWLAAPHPLLGGISPAAAVNAGRYRAALALANACSDLREGSRSPKAHGDLLAGFAEIHSSGSSGLHA